MSNPAESGRPLQGVAHEALRWGDYFTGTKVALVAAGVAPDDLFPGMPGRGKVSCTYFNGVPVGKGGGGRGRKGVGYLQIRRINGGRYEVCLGITPEEHLRRVEAKRQAELARVAAESMARNPGIADRVREIGEEQRLIDVFKQSLQASPARFQVGEKAILDDGYDDGLEVEIVQGFGAYKVQGCDSLRLGYVIRQPDGNEYFFAAGALATLDGKPSHLRLVSQL